MKPFNILLSHHVKSTNYYTPRIITWNISERMDLGKPSNKNKNGNSLVFTRYRWQQTGKLI